MKAQQVDQVYCRGLNTRISVRGRSLVTSNVLPPRRTEIPLSEIKTVQLVVSSVFPPVLLSLSGVAVLIGLWWFAGSASWPVMMDETCRSISSWAMFAAVLGIVFAGYAWAFAQIRITTIGDEMRVVISMVPRRSGERFVSSLMQMMRSTGQ